MRKVALGIAMAGLSLSGLACSGTEPPPRAPGPSVLASTAADTRDETASESAASMPTPISAYPMAPTRLTQTKTLGQGEDLQYFPTYPYAVPLRAADPSVVVVNNTVVNNYGVGTGYGYGGGYGFTPRASYGGGRTFTPAPSSYGGVSVGGAPSVGGSWPSVPSYGPRATGSATFDGRRAR